MKAECGVSVRTAERYMKLAAKVAQPGGVKYDSVSHLTLSEVHRAVARPQRQALTGPQRGPSASTPAQVFEIKVKREQREPQEIMLQSQRPKHISDKEYVMHARQVEATKVAAKSQVEELSMEAEFVALFRECFESDEYERVKQFLRGLGAPHLADLLDVAPPSAVN